MKTATLSSAENLPGKLSGAANFDAPQLVTLNLRRAKQSLWLFAMILVMLLGISNSYAATRTASVTGNWDNPTTWGGSSVPGSGDDAIINSGVTVTVNVTAICNTLTFLQSASSNSNVNINSGITLTVTGAITIPKPSSSTNTLAVGEGNLNAASIAFTSSSSDSRHQLTISNGTVTVSGDITTDQPGSTGPKISFSGAGLLKVGGSQGIWHTSGGGALTNGTGSLVSCQL